MNKKILVLLVLCLLVISSFLYAADEKVQIKFLHRWTQYMDYFEEIVKEFEEAHPNIDVEMQAISNDPFKEKIKIVLGTDEAPDVFFSWPGEFTNRFIRADKVLDITPYLEEDGWLETFIPSQIAPFIYEGKYYGTPFRLDGKVFFYNKVLFEKAGIEKIPETFDELIEDCQKLENIGVTPIAFGNIRPWAVSHYIGTLNQKMVTDETRYADLDPAEGTWTDPGYVEALEKYVELIPYFNDFVNALTHDDARATFFNSNAAMMYLEIVEVPELEMYAGDELKENWGVFVFPDIPEGKGDQDYLTGYPEGFVVSGTTKHPEEAVEFLKFLTGKTAGKLEVEMLGWINGIKNVVGPEDNVPEGILETVDLVLNAEEMVNWLDSSLSAKVWDAYSTQLQMLTDGYSTPEKVMEAVQKAAAEVRKEFE